MISKPSERLRIRLFLNVIDNKPLSLGIHARYENNFKTKGALKLQ
jgi:hypothetical protein